MSDLIKLAESMKFPDWVARRDRWWTLIIHDLALRGELYDHIPYAFCDEQDDKRQFLRAWEKRPAIRLNAPMVGADILSRKLFGTKHAPHVSSDDEGITDAVDWYMQKTMLDEKMQEAAYWGQAGSIGAVLKVASGKPSVSLWKGQLCKVKHDDSGELTEMIISYLVTGADFMNDPELPVNVDWEGQELKKEENYWYIRLWNDTFCVTFYPVKEDQWNPKNGRDVLEFPFLPSPKTEQHDLGFVPAHWIKNFPGNQDPTACDGKALAAGAIDNCIVNDYFLSQMMRGLLYTAAPKLMIKGVPTKDGANIMGPSTILQLPPDHKRGEDATSGADAKMLEITGDGMKVGLEVFSEKLKRFSLEIMSISRKDPDTITGAMSGKAMELIDEEFVDLVTAGQMRYGKYGQLKIIEKGAKMCIKAELEKFKGLAPEKFEELKLEWPKIYTASPQEAALLITAVLEAIASGLWEFEEGKQWLLAQIGKSSETWDADVDPADAGKKLNMEYMMGGPKDNGTAKPKPAASSKGKS